MIVSQESILWDRLPTKQSELCVNKEVHLLQMEATKWTNPKKTRIRELVQWKQSIHHARSVESRVITTRRLTTEKKLSPSAGYPVCDRVAARWLYRCPSGTWRHPCLAFYILFVRTRPFRRWVSRTIRISISDCVPFRAFSVQSHICRSHSHSIHT